MTGMAAHNNGLAGLANPGWDWSLPDGVMTIVDYFNGHGYETVHSGMQHERQDKHHNHYSRVLPYDGWVENAVDGAIHFLENRQPDDKPFYLNIGTNEVHSGQWQSYKPDRSHTRAHDLYGSLDPASIKLPAYLPDFPEIRREWAAFAGCVQYWDSQIGRLLNTIERLGYYENTVVVLTTDHGVATHRGKGTLYREGVEIALAIRCPGLDKRGRVTDALIPNIDLLPTLLDACGIDPRSEVQGRSFLPLLLGQSYCERTHVCLERNFHTDFDPIRSIRSRDFTLIENYDQGRFYCATPDQVTKLQTPYTNWFTQMWPKGSLPRPRLEMFDRRQDKQEFTNIANNPAYQSILQQLQQQLHEWMHATSDPILETTESESFKAIMNARLEQK